MFVPDDDAIARAELNAVHDIRDFDGSMVPVRYRRLRLLLDQLRRATRVVIRRFRFGNNVVLHSTVRLGRLSTVRPAGGRIVIGAHSYVHDHALLMAYGGEITLGEHCTVNPFCVLYGHGGLHIGNHVRIATHSVLIPANHEFGDRQRLIRVQGIHAKGIRIEDDVWIGAGVRILDGVCIGKGCVIGAGSVVTRSIPEYTIALGAPARVVGPRP
jgi:acetyltransferase-like isoleucine patch superfamily enzyme